MSTTIPSSSVPLSHTQNEDQIAAMRQSLQKLYVQRQSLELEAKSIMDELQSGPNPMGIDAALVDNEGFPRFDIDIYRARTLRGRLAVIKTDLINLTNQIDLSLQKLAMIVDVNKAEEERQEIQARLQPKPKPKFDPVTQKWVVRNWDGSIAGAGTIPDESLTSNTIGAGLFDSVQSETSGLFENDGRGVTATVQTTNSSGEMSDNHVHHPVPLNFENIANKSLAIARVNSVEDNSPAQYAGLLSGDLILAFGSITLHESNLTISTAFHEIGELVARSAGTNQTIQVLLLRTSTSGESNVHSVLLQPQPWIGRGFLGCHIVPV